MIEIRQANPGDAPEIVDLNRHVQQLHADACPQIFKHPDEGSFTEEDARALMAQPGHITFIAEIDHNAAGYVIAEERRQPESNRIFARNTMFIHEISVRSEARRSGVGRALISAVREYGQSVEIDLLELQTWSFNQEAQAFFKNSGLAPYRMVMWNLPD